MGAPSLVRKPCLVGSDAHASSSGRGALSQIHYVAVSNGTTKWFALHTIPGHALHEKNLEGQKSVGPLGSSQEQRGLLVLVINPLSTADRPLVKRSLCSPISLNRVSLARASGEMFRRRVFDALEGTRDACLLGELFCRRPVLPDPASPPRHALPRPDPPAICPGFRFDMSKYNMFVLQPAKYIIYPWRNLRTS